MGPPPPSAPPPPPLLPGSASGAHNWFFSSSDRDTQLLTQALTRELSTPPSPSCASSPLLGEALNTGFSDRNDSSNWSQTLHLVGALPQQEQVAAAAITAVGAVPALQQDGFHSSLQRGSPPSSNSQFSASNPGSPYSSLTTTGSAISMSTDSLLARIKSNMPLHQDAKEGLFGSFTESQTLVSLSPAEIHNLNSSSLHSSARAATMALSSQASMGAGESKVRKRRCRANNRAPIVVLSADVSNFREMVQQLTSSRPSSNPPSMHSFFSSSLLKPHPTKQQYSSCESLPTLDTSACFFGSETAMKNPLQGFSFALHRNQQPSPATLPCVDGSGMHGLHNDFQPYARHSLYGDQPNVSSSSSTMPGIWNYAAAPRLRESFPSMVESQKISTTPDLGASEEHHLPSKSQYSAMDSWFSIDGVLAHHAPDFELARMA